jgi:DUF971 family protein
MQPTSLEKTERGLRITWSDGQTREYGARELREACPCATCREKRGAPPPRANTLTVLSEAEKRPLEIASMRPVGSYAYAITFSDGHGSGLYQFPLLHELGKQVEV